MDRVKQVEHVKCIVTNYMIPDLANMVVEYFDPIVYNIYNEEPDCTYMNWVGDYTYGSTFVRGTRLSFRPEHLLVVLCNYESLNVKTFMAWAKCYERDSTKFHAPLPLSDFNVLFWNDASNALSFEDPGNFNRLWNLLPTSFEKVKKWDNDMKQKLKDTYSFVWKNDHQNCDPYFVFTKEQDTIQKIREEMNAVFEIGKTNNVTYEWV